MKLTRKPKTAEQFIAEAESTPEHLIPETPPPSEDRNTEKFARSVESPTTLELQEVAGEEAAPPELSDDSQPEAPDTPQKQKRKKRMPWERGSVREDVAKAFNLRLPEPYYLKLKYIADNTPLSMQGFIHKVLFPAIDSKIASMRRQDETAE